LDRVNQGEAGIGMDLKYQPLLNKLKGENSRYLPRLLPQLVSLREIPLLLALPAGIEEIAQDLNLDPADCRAMLERLCRRGLVYPPIDPDEVEYYLVRDAGQLFEGTVQDRNQSREVIEIWAQWSQDEYMDKACREREAFAWPTNRVIPLPAAIPGQTAVLPVEDLNSIINNAEALAVMNCPCRTVLHRCEMPVEVCLLMGEPAEVEIKRDIARPLSSAQALEIVDLASRRGLVPTVRNRARVNNICFCCRDCCLVITPVLQRGFSFLAPSRFRAQVDQEKCIGCGNCEMRCPFGAVIMKGESGGKMLSRVKTEACYGCGVCVTGCPSGALSLYPVSEEVMIPPQKRRPPSGAPHQPG